MFAISVLDLPFEKLSEEVSNSERSPASNEANAIIFYKDIQKQ
jgi:hypothetical protein